MGELKEITEEVVNELVDQEALDIVFYLQGKTRISEFIIAEELDLEIHKTRNLLYQLLEHNIVSFMRKKDKIKGWYICYWDFNEYMIPYLSDKIREDKVKKLQERLTREDGGQFYMCRNACARMDFEKAIEFNFKCPECGEIMNLQNNLRTIEFLKNKIGELESVRSAQKRFPNIRPPKTESEEAAEIEEAAKEKEALEKAEAKKLVEEKKLAQKKANEEKRAIAKKLAEKKAKEKKEKALLAAKKKLTGKKTVKKTTTKKVATKKSPVKKVASKKSPVKKTTNKKTLTKKTTTKKVSSKKQSNKKVKVKKNLFDKVINSVKKKKK